LRSLAIANAGLGLADEAERIIAGLEASVPFESEPYFGGTVVQVSALIHTRLGHYDEAVEKLESILVVPAVVSIPMLRLDPRWAPLWELPEFVRLEQKYGEPTSSAS